MNITYRVTKDVRHLCVYTADVDAAWTGHYRAICGAGSKGRLEFTNIFASEADYEYAMRRPICKRCARQAHGLAIEVGVAR